MKFPKKVLNLQFFNTNLQEIIVNLRFSYFFCKFTRVTFNSVPHIHNRDQRHRNWDGMEVKIDVFSQRIIIIISITEN